MRHAVGFVLVVVMVSLPARAVVVGQSDHFSLADSASWQTVQPLHYGVPADGGPAGASDAYLKAWSDANNELRINNTAQWSGNYTAAGVTAISADLRNLSGDGLGYPPTTLEIRLLIQSGQQVGGIPMFTSTQAVILQPDSLWHHVVFGLAASDLTGTGDLNAALHQVVQLSFRHQSGSPTVGNGTPIFSIFGIDNITALPEPETLATLAFAALLLRRKRRS